MFAFTRQVPDIVSHRQPTAERVRHVRRLETGDQALQFLIECHLSVVCHHAMDRATGNLTQETST